MKTRYVGVTLVAALCLGAGIAAAPIPDGGAAQDVAGTDVAVTDASLENLSSDRTVGVGIQVGYPWGGLISTRYWLSPEIGVEGIVFADGSAGWFEGTLTLRSLFRVVDASTVDFYVAAGATLPFPLYGGSEVFFVGVGGIELNFRFAPNLAWNIEFGVGCSTLGTVQMALGTGIHFYF